MNKILRRASLFGLTSLLAIITYAQGNLDADLNRAEGALNSVGAKITKYYEPVAQIVLVIAAIIGLIGGIKVYSKFNNGDPDVGKTAASWFGSVIFIVVAVYALRIMFIPR